MLAEFVFGATSLAALIGVAFEVAEERRASGSRREALWFISIALAAPITLVIWFLVTGRSSSSESCRGQRRVELGLVILVTQGVIFLTALTRVSDF